MSVWLCVLKPVDLSRDEESQRVGRHVVGAR